MRAHKIYPVPPRKGNEREALITFSYPEFLGLLNLLNTTVAEADPSKEVILSFENSSITYAPLISCIYTKKELK